MLVEWRKVRDVGAQAELAATRGRSPADPTERDTVRLRKRITALDADLDTGSTGDRGTGENLRALLDECIHESARRVHAVDVRAVVTAAVQHVRDQGMTELAPLIRTAVACTAAGRSRATNYRRHRISALPSRRSPIRLR